ncbi:MAG: hypothetical protein JSS83_27410 [Cyanobacteria bacterium SZAS LIN-3]|nr:hypothetical protein [Cyanobacteria bacterium SZAS LIN-3]MBS2010419.1 hypothetical protein [Cyanobacteria bacterium SZAS TMP-1]
MIGIPLGAGIAIAAIIAMLLYVPNPFRDTLRDIVKIRTGRIKKASTTPIERELELIAGPQRVIEESHAQVQDLRGSLQHESNVLMQRQDDLAAAEAQYYKAADDKNDSGIDELVLLVAEREQEVAIQKNVVDGIQAAVAAACGGVDKARKELRHVQLTIKSDEAKAKATQALDAAAKVMEAARTITANGGALKEASGEVNRDFEAARARVDGFQGTPVERELKAMSDRQEMSELRKRLDAKRAAQNN